jgi:cardiolipin synthase
MWLERQDLRVHRKIIVIDSKVAWTGSMNLVDPGYFNIDAGVGQWVDSMIRLTGPISVLLKSIVLNDWQVETGRNLYPRLKEIEVRPVEGSAVCQLAPSGPASPDDSVEEILLAAVYGATERIRLTTPYFVPGDALVTALKSAAHRGVDVSLVIPKKNDSKLVALAASSYYEELIEAGVNIYIFDSGLLHSKIVLIDDELALFGTVNLDMRSFWLNFELTVAIYDSKTVGELHSLVDSYHKKCTVLNLARWHKRPLHIRILQQLAYLTSPLL